MNFKAGDLYHIYNQGNNRIPVFFTRANYLLFLKKIKLHILPYADILAWCLMPNHFHLMVSVKEVTISDSISGSATQSLTPGSVENILLNKSIGILLSSYARAINEQEHRTGSLFRIHTHAECLTTPDLHTPSFFNTSGGTLINRHFPEEEYPQVCFNYIHQNPVKAGLVKLPEDWEFSSCRDYYSNRNGKLINKKRAEEFGLI